MHGLYGENIQNASNGRQLFLTRAHEPTRVAFNAFFALGMKLLMEARHQVFSGGWERD